MPKQIIRYQCNFCRKHYSAKHDATIHKKGCLRNPINKSCSTCFNAINGTEPVCAVTGEKIFVKNITVKHCENWTENDIEMMYQ